MVSAVEYQIASRMYLGHEQPHTGPRENIWNGSDSSDGCSNKESQIFNGEADIIGNIILKGQDRFRNDAFEYSVYF